MTKLKLVYNYNMIRIHINYIYDIIYYTGFMGYTQKCTYNYFGNLVLPYYIIEMKTCLYNILYIYI